MSEEIRAILMYSAVIIPYALLYYARKPGKLGKVGAAIRNSDRWALEDAIAEKEEEIKNLELNQNSFDLFDYWELDYKKQTLQELKGLRKKYLFEHER